jgi:orotate phosphoribosyltransferase
MPSIRGHAIAASTTRLNGNRGPGPSQTRRSLDPDEEISTTRPTLLTTVTSLLVLGEESWYTKHAFQTGRRNDDARSGRVEGTAREEDSSTTMELPIEMQTNALLRRLEEEGAVAYANRIPVGFKLTPVAVQPDWRFDLARQGAIEEHCEGHFLLPSGKHTNVYIQVSLGLRYVGTSKAVGFQLYKRLQEAGLLDQIDVLIGPPVGALAVVTALQYTIDSPKTEAMYLDRDAGGSFRLGRGFQLQGGKRILLVDDVYTTGGSLRKAIAACNAAVRDVGEECHFVGAAVVLNRVSDPEAFRLATVTMPIVSAVHYPLRDWDAAACPYCAHQIPLFAVH